MATGMEMMLKSLISSIGLKPEMLENVAKAVQSAARDLQTIRQQNEEILLRLRALTPEITPVAQLTEVSSGGRN